MNHLLLHVPKWQIVASLNQQAYVAWLLVACGLSLYRYIIACFFLELQGQDIDPPTIMVQWRNFTPLKITFGSISISQVKLLFCAVFVGNSVTKVGTSRFVPPLPIPTVAGWFTSQFTSLMAQTWACAHVGAMCGCNVGPVQSCTREKLQETLRSQRERNVTKVWQDLISHVTPYMVKYSISPQNRHIYIFSIDLLSIKYLIPMMNVVFFCLSSLNCEHRTFHQATSSLPRCIAWTLHFFAGRWQPRINQNSSWKSWSWQAMKLRGAWNWQSQGINGYEWFIVI